MFADVPQDEPEVHAAPGFEHEVSAYNLFAYLSRSDVTWNPSVCSVVKDSLFCPTSEEYILPVEHGNDRCEWFNVRAAIGGSAFAIFHNQGQACIAGSRLILHKSIAEEFLDGFTRLAQSIRLGDPLDPQTEMGPLTSKMHQERVLQFCQVAKDEGGEVITGGKQPERDDLANGYFVEPTTARRMVGLPGDTPVRADENGYPAQTYARG
ncbi:aldehyde dehydrogenase family protein [Mesorhizobium sp. KR2-14]|uniref:aldehyde dehydrogenase family protein n=1 Tax=Mesorhizobium sp. KR2-14 TaxID=3156610 RepID=UPI0032B358BC